MKIPHHKYNCLEHPYPTVCGACHQEHHTCYNSACTQVTGAYATVPNEPNPVYVSMFGEPRPPWEEIFHEDGNPRIPWSEQPATRRKFSEDVTGEVYLGGMTYYQIRRLFNYDPETGNLAGDKNKIPVEAIQGLRNEFDRLMDELEARAEAKKLALSPSD